MYKICSQCNKSIVLTDFYTDLRNVDGKYSYCKFCAKKYGNTRTYAWIERNKEKWKMYSNEYGKKWRKNNYDKVLQTIWKRRKLLKVGGTHSSEEWENLKKEFKNKCLNCKVPEQFIKLSRDHIIPITLGGDNTIKNIQPLCLKCNLIKGTKIISYK